MLQNGFIVKTAGTSKRHLKTDRETKVKVSPATLSLCHRGTDISPHANF